MTKVAKTTDKVSKGKREKVCIRDKVVIALGKASARLTSMAERLTANAPEAAEALKAALSQLDNACAAMRELGEDFRFSAGRGAGAGRARVEVGAVVDLREKRRGKFEGLLTEEETTGLKVVKLIGSRIKVETKGGTALILSRGDVMLGEEASA